MATFGIFGKMPAVGDFVSRGLSPALCEQLDRMLQAALVAAASDGADPRELMGRAAPLMVVIRPGSICSTGFTGVWYPSRDRVGRVFPLCVGLETQADKAQVPLLWPSRALTHLLCLAVVRAVQANGGPDELMAGLPDEAAWNAALVDGLPFSDVGDETVPAIISGDRALFSFGGPEPAMVLSDRALCSRLPWVVQMLGIRVGPDGGPDRFFANRSMLSWSEYAALFDSRWSHWQWCSEPVNDDTVPATSS